MVIVKSINLKITLAAASAALVGGCEQSAPDWTAQQDTAVCVDRQNNRVPDQDCDRSYGGGGHSSAFLWYYLGRNSRVPYYGDRVTGGSFTRTAGATYFHAPVTTAMTRSTAVSRGGFGASAHAFGGFGE